MLRKMFFVHCTLFFLIPHFIISTAIDLDKYTNVSKVFLSFLSFANIKKNWIGDIFERYESKFQFRIWAKIWRKKDLKKVLGEWKNKSNAKKNISFFFSITSTPSLIIIIFSVLI